MKKEFKQDEEMIGNKFGKLTVLRRGENQGKFHVKTFVCVCECGKERVARKTKLRFGGVKSCGSFACRFHGCRLFGKGIRHELYQTWRGMIGRCHNPNDKAYKYYGGRGIKVCDEWRHDPKRFFSDMGKRPIGLTLERINNDGKYEQSNCKWATRKEQARNRQVTTWVTLDGKKSSLTEVAERHNINAHTLRDRLSRGDDIRRALRLDLEREQKGEIPAISSVSTLSKREG